MPPSPTLIARDQRILAGHAAGATIPDLALAEEVDPAVIRRVLRAAGITPGRPPQLPAPIRSCSPRRFCPAGCRRRHEERRADRTVSA